MSYDPENGGEPELVTMQIVTTIHAEPEVAEALQHSIYERVAELRDAGEFTVKTWLLTNEYESSVVLSPVIVRAAEEIGAPEDLLEEHEETRPRYTLDPELEAKLTNDMRDLLSRHSDNKLMNSRIYNALCRSGVNTVREVLVLGSAWLKEQRSTGNRCVDIVREALEAEFGAPGVWPRQFHPEEAARWCTDARQIPGAIMQQYGDYSGLSSRYTLYQLANPSHEESMHLGHFDILEDEGPHFYLTHIATDVVAQFEAAVEHEHGYQN